MDISSNRGGRSGGRLPDTHPVPDRIEIRGLRALGVCGVLPEEQQRPQPLEVDLVIEADLAEAGTTDDLVDTIDYAVTIEAVERVVATERFRLLERLATRLAEVVLVDERISAVEVVVRKLRPPVAHHVDTTGVRIVRGR
ncbi:dihydroneopterin aldolase [Rhabdothermincola sediminis]|uniref:dihydroneopterin aldolase n=1 Tax=Rhabdothermincola sediminis TaxID=2751370 RepID=UPI001AA04CCE|nr:dihydroneopterin aldolase [Rhabdothermincola sediminis]